MTKLKVSSPAELISAVPFLIGFHPEDSLTVVAMRGPVVAFSVRADLPELDTPVEEARAAILHLADVVVRQQVQAVVIIGYGEEKRVAPAVLRISDIFTLAGLVVIDELRVEDGRFWSFLCADPSCCPEDGVPCLPRDSVMAAEATFAGAVALPSREVFLARVAPVTGDDREAMTAATTRAMKRLSVLAPAESPFLHQVRRAGREAVRAAERCYRVGGRLTDDDVAWLGLLLMHVPVRDYAWMRTGTKEWELSLWSDLMRRVEPIYAPAPASLLAFVAWRSGNGVLASVAVERALDEQEDYALARLVDRVLTDGVHPAILDGWPALAGGPDLATFAEDPEPEDPEPEDPEPESPTDPATTDPGVHADSAAGEPEAGPDPLAQEPEGPPDPVSSEVGTRPKPIDEVPESGLEPSETEPGPSSELGDQSKQPSVPMAPDQQAAASCIRPMGRTLTGQGDVVHGQATRPRTASRRAARRRI
ncbi:DUF4192 domain-containing protein [Actinoplanes friuliensis]